MKNKSCPIPYFDFGTLFKSTKHFIDQHNYAKHNLKERFNANHRATAELITRLYAKQLNKAVKINQSLDKELSGFKTYNSSLASCKGCTVRTIINHKERLKAAKFITKICHGKSGIELWINPSIFRIPKLSTSNSDLRFKTKEIIAFSGYKVKKNHPLVQEQQEQKHNNRDVNSLQLLEKTGKNKNITRTPRKVENLAVTKGLFPP